MRSALCLVALAGCLDSPPPTVAEAPARPLLKVQPPAFEDPPAPKPDTSFDRDTELRAAISDGRLSLIPIVTDANPSQHYISLRSGMASGKVIAIDGGVIEEVSISNRSDQPVAILGGELIVGGHQDRLIVHNTVVPAHRTQTITTVCAELSRNDGPPGFHAAPALAEPTLRALVRGRDQFKIWDRISALTGTVGESYRHAAILNRKNTDRLTHVTAELDQLDRREDEKTVGFAVAIDNKVIAIEHFATPGLYRELRSEVIASYLPSSAGTPKHEITVGANEVRAFREATGAGGPVPPRNPAGAPSAAKPALR